ncbi:unnamed protein product [Closterium sp. NIES-54]
MLPLVASTLYGQSTIVAGPHSSLPLSGPHRIASLFPLPPIFLLLLLLLLTLPPSLPPPPNTLSPSIIAGDCITFNNTLTLAVQVSYKSLLRILKRVFSPSIHDCPLLPPPLSLLPLPPHPSALHYPIPPHSTPPYLTHSQSVQAYPTFPHMLASEGLSAVLPGVEALEEGAKKV